MHYCICDDRLTKSKIRGVGIVLNGNVSVVIASHGEYAAGIVSALKLLVDHNIEVVSLCAYCGDIKNTADVMDKLREYARRSFEDGNELVVFTDIFGGSVTNIAAMVLIDNPHMHVVAGVTLVMMMEFFLSEGDSDSLKTRINSALEISKEAGNYLNECNELKNEHASINQENVDDFFN